MMRIRFFMVTASDAHPCIASHDNGTGAALDAHFQPGGCVNYLDERIRPWSRLAHGLAS
jgi:hypothetical protein